MSAAERAAATSVWIRTREKSAPKPRSISCRKPVSRGKPERAITRLTLAAAGRVADVLTLAEIRGHSRLAPDPPSAAQARLSASRSSRSLAAPTVNLDPIEGRLGSLLLFACRG